MPRIETSVDVERPRAEVFSYLSDLRNALQWSTGLVDVSYDDELAEGTTGVDTRKMGGKEIQMPWRVTAFEPTSRIVFEYEAPFPMTAAFSFESAGAATRVTCTTELRPRGWWRLLSPFMAREGKKTDELQFQKVKRILEEGRATASSGEERR